ncbi:MAG: class I SAM-dependent methyltransferase [Oscillospiraceae bacterium]
MNEVNKTLYIPLYGKAQVSRKNIILNDRKAEEIWEKEQFPLKGKSKSKWLCYYMAMRARVFDDWTEMKMRECSDALVLHIGCGMDSRYLRVGSNAAQWYDIDFPSVIEERRKYYEETENYHMLCCDVSDSKQLDILPEGDNAVIILEGISMYLLNKETAALFDAFAGKYKNVSILMDVYTTFAAKASKYKNPVNDVGVTKLYGIDDPDSITNNSISYVREHTMTPEKLTGQLPKSDRGFFKMMFAGKATRKIYRLFEYAKNKNTKR